MMKQKRFLSALLTIALLACLSATCLAVDSSMSFDFCLTSDGSDVKYTEPGDIITISLTLKRTDSGEDYPQYAMQDEITYDPAFFELVDTSIMTKKGVASTDIGLMEGYRSFYMNSVSMGDGDVWAAETLVGTFQLRVLASQGSSVVENRNCIVGIESGMDSYETAAKNLTVVVTGDCTVHFETYDGTPVPDQIVKLGEKVIRPEDPVWEGHYLENWYKDWYLTEPWDFDNDVVEGNMNLYAGYAIIADPGDDAEAEPETGGLPGWLLPVGTGIGLLILLILLLLFLTRIPVVFAQAGGAELKKIRVRRSGKVVLPKELAGKTWYKDAALTQAWNFAEDTITEKTTLYTRE